VAMALTRQKVPFITHPRRAPASDVAKGGYVLVDCESGAPDIVLMASGSEVGIILQAQQKLQDEDRRQVRVVSMPSHELFLTQSPAYRASVLPAGVPRVAIEAAHSMSWARFLGERDAMIGIDHFGASAPFQRIYDEFGLTVDHVVAKARGLLVSSTA